ncbi:MAG TPA: hypothetical protein PKA64_19595, partial [Myxococcota bacterium]|nr:hypothetical protein [Myxococcota bacterium]
MWAWMWLAAGDLVHPEWSELAPWRTWAVVENVQPARHWFVLDPIPVLGKRCEVGLVAEGRRGPPVVWCGPARIGDAAVQDAPASMKKEERAARDALRPYLGDSAEALDGLRMRFLGTLRDVTFRQIVVVEPAADPGQARAITLTATWQVDPVSGRVDRGPVPPDTRVGPVCLPGIHTGCDQPPRLLEWAPE